MAEELMMLDCWGERDVMGGGRGVDDVGLLGGA